MENKKNYKREGITLNSPTPIDDGLKKFNIIYYILAIGLALWVIIYSFSKSGEFNYAGVLMAICFGLIFGWTIKSMIARIKMV